MKFKSNKQQQFYGLRAIHGGIEFVIERILIMTDSSEL